MLMFSLLCFGSATIHKDSEHIVLKNNELFNYHNISHMTCLHVHVYYVYQTHTHTHTHTHTYACKHKTSMPVQKQ